MLVRWILEHDMLANAVVVACGGLVFVLFAECVGLTHAHLSLCRLGQGKVQAACSLLQDLHWRLQATIKWGCPVDV